MSTNYDEMKMSYRGSFCTEYIYCGHCLAAAKAVLLSNDKRLCSTMIPTWEEQFEEPTLPIIAGKVGGNYDGEEVEVIREQIADLEMQICHPIRIAVLGENRQELMIAYPKNR